MERSERVATNLTPEQKRDFKIAAMRREKSEAEVLRGLVEEFLDEEEIPEEVREYFEGQLDEGNATLATVTAD